MGHTQYKTMYNALNGTQARGRQNLSIFFGEIIKFKQNIHFLTVYHWDKQVIDFFGNYRHLNKSARKTTGEVDFVQ